MTITTVAVLDIQWMSVKHGPKRSVEATESIEDASRDIINLRRHYGNKIGKPEIFENIKKKIDKNRHVWYSTAC
jgi:hypothetical protein